MAAQLCFIGALAAVSAGLLGLMAWQIKHETRPGGILDQYDATKQEAP